MATLLAKDDILGDPKFNRVLVAPIVAALQMDADRLPKDYVMTTLARKMLIKWTNGLDREKLLPLKNSLIHEVNRARQNTVLWEQSPAPSNKAKPMDIPRIFAHVAATAATVEFVLTMDEGKIIEALDHLSSIPSIGESNCSILELIEGVGRLYTEGDTTKP